jgi:hypothetical protein
MKCSASVGIAICAMIFPLTNGRAETTTICGQTVNYFIAPPAAALSSELRAYHGIWTGDAKVSSGVSEGIMCIGFVIESIAPDATVGAKYIWGDGVKFPANGARMSIKPGVSTWVGKIAGNALNFVSGDRKYSFELRVSGNEMRGLFFTPDGQGDVQMRRR